jgi:hypothetical protein
MISFCAMFFLLVSALLSSEPIEQVLFPNGLPSKTIQDQNTKAVLQWKEELEIEALPFYEATRLIFNDVSYTHPESFLTWHDLRLQLLGNRNDQWRLITSYDYYPELFHLLTDDWDLRDCQAILSSYPITPDMTVIYLNLLVISHTLGAGDIVQIFKVNEATSRLEPIYSNNTASRYLPDKSGGFNAYMNHLYFFDVENDGILELFVQKEQRNRKPSEFIKPEFSEVDVYRLKEGVYSKVQTIPNLPRNVKEIPRCSKNVFFQLKSD